MIINKLTNMIDLLNMKTSICILIYILMMFSTMFLSCHMFVEVEIISKWYAFVGGSLLCLFIPQLLFKRMYINFDQITVFLLVFISYLLLRMFLSELDFNNTLILSIIAFVVLYFSFRLMPVDYLHNIDVIILLVCIMQACYGLIQYAGIFHINNRIMGSFDNPAGFAASLATGFPFCFSMIKKRDWRFYMGGVGLVIIALSVTLSGSRAGIIAISMTAIVYLVDKYDIFTKRYRKYILLVICVLLVGGLFLLKKDSAVGRIFIWKNSYDMIADNPVFGQGSGAFMANYMLYQSDYFAKNPNNKYVLLADNVSHPFNEYLLLAVEFGVVGLLLLLLMLIVIIKSSKRLTIPLLCLFSVGIFACFSYPLRYPFVLLLLAYTLASLKTKEIYIISINFFGKAIVGCLMGLIYIFLVNDIIFEKTWGRLAQNKLSGKTTDIFHVYDTLYSQWNGDPLFLYNYGAVLNQSKDYVNSNVILKQCAKYLNDYDVQMIIADNYYNMKQWSEAERCYIVAKNMIPCRFSPFYKLMLLYKVSGNNSQAYRTASIITKKKIKIHSNIVNKIKSEAEIIVRAGMCT